MIVEVEVGGQRRKVGISPGGVTLDGRAITVDVARVGLRWSLLIGPAAAGRDAREDTGAGSVSQEAGAAYSRPWKSYEVAIARQPGGETIVHVNGRLVPVVIAGSAATFGARVLATRAKPRGEGGPQRVQAPMPGRIVEVLVAVGDTVAARQGLVVIEAMKMENELRSPKAGRVSEVRVVTGASVEAHAVLVVVE
jgi:biotin carboxyl carrier protein